MFVGFGVDAAFEIDAVDAPVVPPLPGGLSGANPCGVVQTAGGSEAVDQIAVEQSGILCDDGCRAPRKGSRTPDAGDVRFGFGHEALDVVVPAGSGGFGTGREDAPQRRTPAVVVEVHARIAFQIGFGDADSASRGEAYRQRQEHQPLRVQFRKRGVGVDILERVVELLCESFFGSLAVEHIGDDGFMVGGEVEPDEFVGHRPRRVVEREEAVGDAVVIGPEIDAVTASEGQRQLFVTVPDGAFAVERARNQRIGFRVVFFHDLRLHAPYGAVGESHRQRRRGEDDLSGGFDAVGEAVAARHLEDDAAVGRGEAVIGRRNRQR